MKRVLLLIGSVLSFGLLVALIPYSSSQLQSSIASVPQPLAVDPLVLRGLQSQYKGLKKQLAQFAPHQHYILVDTARNHLYIKRSQEIVLDAIASTGSGVVLDKPGEGNTQWVFDTPRGEFTVQSKLTHPAWVKPDCSQESRRPGRARCAGRLCARVRQRLFYSWHALYPTARQERHPWVHSAQ